MKSVLRSALLEAWGAEIRRALRRRRLPLRAAEVLLSPWVHRSTIKKWRRGNGLPSMITACAAAGALGTIRLTLRIGTKDIGTIVIRVLALRLWGCRAGL